MKITLGKIADSLVILNKIKQQSSNFKINYWIMRNMKILSDSFNFFINNREKIYEKYCNKIKTDNNLSESYYEIKDDGTINFNIKENVNVDDFNKEMMDLINMECEDIKPYLLNVETIYNNTDEIKISVDEIFEIDYLLNNE